jgi:multicomponent Na+:H+ antiporter subunit F
MKLTAWSAYAALVMLAAALILALVRLLRGPSLPDRVVALDLMSTLAVGVIAAHSVLSGHAVYLDVAVMLALIAFLGTVAFARYLAMRGGR